MPLQLAFVIVLAWAGHAPAATTLDEVKPLLKAYEAYLYEGKGDPAEVFSARLRKSRLPPAGALKGEKKEAWDPKVDSAPFDKTHAKLKLGPKDRTSIQLVKENGRWLIDDTLAEEE